MNSSSQHETTGSPGSRKYVDLTELRSFGVYGRDEGVGVLHDLLIEDQTWSAQYLVIDAGAWMPGRLVLASINAFNYLDMDRRRVVLCYSRTELRRSIARVARLSGTSQKAAEMREYSGSQPLWVAVVPAGEPAQPVLRGSSIDVNNLPLVPDIAEDTGDRAVLRSARDLLGNEVQMEKAVMGRVEAVAVSESDLCIGFVLIRAKDNSRNGLLPLFPGAFSAIGWADKRMKLPVIASTAILSLPEVEGAREITPTTTNVLKQLLSSGDLKHTEADGVH
jgi:hypothetical protein